MPQKLTIQLTEGETIEYGYYDGLEAVCEALQTALRSDYEKLDIEIIESQEEEDDRHDRDG